MYNIGEGGYINMKKFLSILSIAVCLFVTVACSSKIGAVKKAFVNDGYEWQQIDLSSGSDEQSAKDTESVIKGLYLATKGLTGYNIIVELQANKDAKDAVQALKDDPNLDGNSIIQAVVSAYNSSPITYGNCILITLLDSNAVSLFDTLNGK